MNIFIKLGKVIRNRIFLFIGMVVFFMLIPYVIVDLAIKPNQDTYNVSFQYEEEISNIDELVSFDCLQRTKNKIIEIRNQAISEGKKAPYSDFSYVNINKMNKNNQISIQEKTDGYNLAVSTKYFNSQAQARRFLTTLAADEEIVGEVTPIFEDPICYTIEINNYLVLLCSSLGSIFLTLLIVLLIIRFKPSMFEDNIQYDNKKIYRSPFHLSYWKSSLKEVKTVKKMVLLAILFALQLCTKFISIPSGFSNLGLSLGYLVFSVIGMIFGPIVGLFIGFGSDILGYVIKPDGVFFMGYTLSAMIAGFTYGLTFYKTKITFSKCLFARIIVNMFVNVLLGSYWWWIISDKSFSLSTYILITSLPKNLVYLIPQSLLLYYFIKVVSRVLKVNKLVAVEICDNVTLI